MSFITAQDLERKTVSTILANCSFNHNCLTLTIIQNNTSMEIKEYKVTRRITRRLIIDIPWKSDIIEFWPIEPRNQLRSSGKYQCCSRNKVSRINSLSGIKPFDLFYSNDSNCYTGRRAIHQDNCLLWFEQRYRRYCCYWILLGFIQRVNRFAVETDICDQQLFDKYVFS